MLGDRQITANFVKYRLTISLNTLNSGAADRERQARRGHGFHTGYDVGYSNDAGFSNDAGYSDDVGSITGTTLEPSRKRRWIVHLNNVGPLIQTTLYSAKTTLDSPV